MSRYCGRFAPTPSGPLHFGSMVAAIGSYCDARAHCGIWQVRLDDLDPPRVGPGAIEAIMDCLEAFALEPDGDVVYQSRRAPAYHAAVHRLRQLGQVFACACSRKEIGESALAGIASPVYPGTCRGGLPKGRAARALRLRVDTANIEFDDLLQGRVSQHLGSNVGDFVIYRSDRVYSYHLASAIDDAEQGVTHVVRGADLMDSTARQIHIQQLLGLPTPAYLHLPVATDVAGEKLSKQTMARPVNPGEPAATIHAVLEFLGQQPPDALVRLNARQAMEWAVANWRRDRLPGTRAIPVDA